MFDGLHVRGLDQTGLSQKAGPVSSDVRISRREVPPTNHGDTTGLDTLLAFDLLAAADLLDWLREREIEHLGSDTASEEEDLFTPVMKAARIRAARAFGAAASTA